jgi:hypothetical protein
MSWWTRLTRRGRSSGPHAGETAGNLQLPGWSLAESNAQQTVWRNDVGDVLTLSLTESSEEPGSLSDEAAIRERCRRIAQGRSAGLVEVTTVTSAQGAGYKFIDKKQVEAGFLFMGMLVLPATKGSWVWTIMSGERGMTGVREAVVTGLMLESGQLTLESYETSWAQDPYDPSYQGVDRSTLRYMSDAEEYDEQFPEHPLSKVRRELKQLVDVKLEGLAPTVPQAP